MTEKERFYSRNDVFLFFFLTLLLWLRFLTFTGVDVISATSHPHPVMSNLIQELDPVNPILILFFSFSFWEQPVAGLDLSMDCWVDGPGRSTSSHLTCWAAHAVYFHDIPFPLAHGRRVTFAWLSNLNPFIIRETLFNHRTRARENSTSYMYMYICGN